MPEGDTIHRAAARLRPALVGRPLVAFAARRLAPPFPEPGPEVADVTARGKHLLLRFGDGLLLHTHMKMTGSWHVDAPRAVSQRSRAAAVAVVEVEGAIAVCHRAPVVELLDEPALRRHPRLRGLGPDLTLEDVDVDEVVARVPRFATVGTGIGDVLLDQRPGCGIGNVVMQESCFLEGVHPATPVERVDEATRHALYVRAAGILHHNVTTTRRTTVPGGRPGALYVYDRSRRPCRACGTGIDVGTLGRGARPTWWCPSCQPPP